MTWVFSKINTDNKYSKTKWYKLENIDTPYFSLLPAYTSLNVILEMSTNCDIYYSDKEKLFRLYFERPVENEGYEGEDHTYEHSVIDVPLEFYELFKKYLHCKPKFETALKNFSDFIGTPIMEE